MEVPAGSVLRDVGLAAGVPIPSTCGGVGSCGLCRVKITAGAEGLAPLTPVEQGKLGNVFFITRERLSCQVVVQGDLGCEVPDDTAERARRSERQREANRQRMQERARSRGRR